MNAEIICVGTELLLGHVVDTNSAYLSKELAGLGISVFRQLTVGDNPVRIKQAIRQALSRSDLLIITGGLGPTVDDITAKAISEAVGRKLVKNIRILNRIKKYFRQKNIPMSKDVEKQAHIPDGSLYIPNTAGIAPGIVVGLNKKIIVALPGPPREVVPMFKSKISPILKKKFSHSGSIIKTRSIKLSGISESAVNKAVKNFLKLSGDVTVGVYAVLGEVHLKVTAKAKKAKQADSMISAIEKKIRKKLKKFIFGTDSQTLEEKFLSILKTKKLTCSVAESCTGGLLGKRITDVNGSSAFFIGGVIAYSNDFKKDVLQIPEISLKKYGAVSPEVAKKMAVTVQKVTNSDLSISITGIAGPTGGTAKKPVGTVFICVNLEGKLFIRRYQFKGTRQEIKFQSTQEALNLAIEKTKR